MWPTIVLIGILVIGFFNATSFCYVQCRYLPIHELYERAIERQSENIGDYAPGETPTSYLTKHPNCCSIPDYQPNNSWLNLLLGYKIRYIRVVYRLPQDRVNMSPGDWEFYEAFVETSPCGRTYHAIGVRQQTPD